MKVYVYRNLHKNCYSVMHRGRVVMHADNLVLTDVEFRVREAGRQKVIAKKRKNVHAFVVGQLQANEKVSIAGERVAYNPYTGHSFYTFNGNVSKAGKVSLTPNGVFINE